MNEQADTKDRKTVEKECTCGSHKVIFDEYTRPGWYCYNCDKDRNKNV